MNYEGIKRFRQEIYQSLGKAKDAVFDLMDAVLLSRNVSSFAELSLCPVFRRKWASLYEGLADSSPQPEKQREILLKQIPKGKRIILVGDKTLWERAAAPSLKDRGYEIGKSKVSGREVTLGDGYSTVAWIPEEEGSWALPLCHERITSFETAQSKAVNQLQEICPQLSQRPLSLWDSGYGNGKFLKASATIACDKILRLRSNLNLYKVPPAYSGKGRPRKHGTVFKLSDPKSWGEPQETLVMDNSERVILEVKCWRKLHFRNAAEIEVELVRIQRLESRLGCQVSKPLWLAGVLEQPLALQDYEAVYRKRFCIEHWYRFAKQRLHWTLPQFSSTEQCERWSYLMPLLTWQLWLGRELVKDNPLPWQKEKVAGNLSPRRVAQALMGVLVVIGSPSPVPKPRGKSSGWPTGRKRTPKTRYPLVKKHFSAKKKGQKNTS